MGCESSDAHYYNADAMSYALKSRPKVRGWLLAICICHAILFPAFMWSLTLIALILMVANPLAATPLAVLVTFGGGIIGACSCLSGIFLWCRKNDGIHLARLAIIVNALYATLGAFFTGHLVYFTVSLVYGATCWFYFQHSPKIAQIYDEA